MSLIEAGIPNQIDIRTMCVDYNLKEDVYRLVCEGPLCCPSPGQYSEDVRMVKITTLAIKSFTFRDLVAVSYTHLTLPTN